MSERCQLNVCHVIHDDVKITSKDTTDWKILKFRMQFPFLFLFFLFFLKKSVDMLTNDIQDTTGYFV